MTKSVGKTLKVATSPAASGPAGSLFEGQVGAHYLLTMLSGGEPRGLPGTVISRVEFQRASDNRALDDVIVRANDRNGDPAVLEIQVKRTVTFTPSDEAFLSIVAQVAKAATRLDFDSIRYELAVAIERTSTKIERAYQEVLSWARHRESPELFAEHISRAGMASNDMRTFVTTFRENLKLAGAPHDDTAVWRILRRFQILVFDYNQEGSSTEHFARERATMLLAHQDITRAAELWNTLTILALESGAKGGDRNAGSLRDTLTAKHGYRWAGDRSFAAARRALAEASTGALADIKNDVGVARIDRAKRIAQIYSALDVGHYVEIRGDAGVGKSGILKHLAEQIGLEAQVVVFSPDRTIPHGWTSLRSVLGCDASAREFLSDLASDGGAVLFIDGVDFFDDEAQRVTVIDLVRAAAGVPNFSVVVTARRNFGVDEPSWLPTEALDRLGRAPPVLIDDLDTGEIAQLKAANSSLAALLDDSHPARDIVRNLYRLARLVNQAPGDSVPRTEADMAEHWWRSADGSRAGRRDRARLLRTLAIYALAASGPMDSDTQPSTAIQSLIASESLLELQTDRLTFRHDILRDWAIGCLLYNEPERIAELALARPAPAALVRGVELAAHLAAERSTDGAEWNTFVERLSHTGAHGSWRRAALLAVVRSELGAPLLDRVSADLFANDGALLLDLVRMTVAVDSEPGAITFADSSIDPALLPTDFLVPTAPSWHRLIIWSLGAIPNLPKAVIPDLVDLYSRWSMARFGLDPLTPYILAHLHNWLIEIETTLHSGDHQNRQRSFDLNLPWERKRELENRLRMSFLLFCRRTPELAEHYLRAVAKRPAGEPIGREIMKFRGSAAQVAPAALVDLTLRTLIPELDNAERDDRRYFRGPFGFRDADFLPASPAQGPFLELLEHAPSEGLRLVRQIVEHAINYHTKGRDSGDDVITIPFPGGDRKFPWCRSYLWARYSNGSNIVASALMALEAWCHRRIEAGQPFGDVLADVLGTKSVPAAFLLVAVDLLLSHWPKSEDKAWAFMACPELLSLDRNRYSNDIIGSNNPMHLDALMGINEWSRTGEPAGLAKLETLRQRASRKVSLDEMIGHYTLGARPKLLAALQAELSRAVKRLGPPQDITSGMADPCFAALHAANLANLANWKEVKFKNPDGSTGIGHQYQPPTDELVLIEPRQMESSLRLEETNIRLALAAALDERSESSPDLVAKGVAWAHTDDGDADEADDPDAAEWRARTRVIAAALAMRDGDDKLSATCAVWARATFADALSTPDDPLHRFQSRLSLNVVAIVAVGLISLLHHQPCSGDIRTLLELAARREPSMAHAFGGEAATINDIDERLPRSILRVGFAAQIHALPKYEEPEEKMEVRVGAHRQRLSAAVEREIAWLENGQPEPAWPAFPNNPPPPKRPQPRVLISGSNPPPPDPRREWTSPLDEVDHQAAALWIRMSAPYVGAASMHWLRALVESYADWTASANGVGLPDEDDTERTPMEWNNAYFDLVARTTIGLSPDDIDSFALDRIQKLPDEPFFDVMAQFIRVIDDLYFNASEIETNEALRIRSLLMHRLVESRSWRHVIGRNSSNIEMHIGPAIAALFMHEQLFMSSAQCYLLPEGAKRIDVFMPVLADLTIQAARSAYVATLFLSLIEVRVQPQHLGHLVKSAGAWLASYSADTAFWNDLGIGRRICAWLDEVIRVSPDALLAEATPTIELDGLLDGMLRIGVAPARAIEEALAQLRQGRP